MASENAKSTAQTPATRLYNLVKTMRYRGDTDTFPGRIWAAVFGIDMDREMSNPQAIQEVVEGLIAFLSLVDETEQGIEHLELEDFYREAFPPLRQIAWASLSNLKGNHTGLISSSTQAHETLLRVMASRWEKVSPEPVVDETVLKEIHEEAHQLFESTKKAPIEADLKRLILSLAAEIEQAIQQYRIGGVEGLKKSLALIQAQTNLNTDILKAAEGDQTSSVWWNRFYNVAVKLYGAVKFANDTRKTIEGVTPFLQLGGRTNDIPPVDLS